MIHSELARSTGHTTPGASTTVATLAMRSLIGLLLGLVYLAVMLGPGAAAAQGVPVCSWPLETTGTGPSNVAYPDTNATYWTMPFDSSRWKELVITGTYPEARFFSLTTYDAQGAVADSLLDVAVKPDLHGMNPFTPGQAGDGHGQGHIFGNTYTVSISRDGKAAQGGNHLGVAASDLGWVIYRIYVQDKGKDRQGGVDLPVVTLVAHDGSRHPLPPCPHDDFATAVQQLTDLLRDNGFADAADFLAVKAAVGDDGGAGPGGAVCAPDQVAFAIPQNTGGYFPNDANKYVSAPDLCFQPNRIIVVRGQGTPVPDTYNGAPVWQPAGQFQKVAMRYWSMCNNEQEQPYPVVACQVDWATRLDSQGFYTYVISADESGAQPPAPPAWLPPDATWLPWGATDVPNILLFRNMLPAPSFHQSVQAAEAAGCTFDNESGVPVPYEDIVDAGQCAQGVMGAYYPVAVYCDKQLFIARGWQGCFAAASVPVP
jgi:hypothetical protein